jgi:hypothetical protein
MHEYSLLVRVPATYNSELAKSVKPEWDKLLEKWKSDGIYITSFAFPGESYFVIGQEKKVEKETLIARELRIVSNLAIRANTMEEAIELAKSCPILKHGGTVEVREIPAGVQRSN